MNLSGTLRLAVGAGLACAALGAPVAAQITTATVTGTVVDQQGGVIPGATVTLVSETQSTRSTPAVTSAVGDFVIANVTAGTYTLEATRIRTSATHRSGCRARRRTGRAASPTPACSAGFRRAASIRRA